MLVKAYTLRCRSVAVQMINDEFERENKIEKNKHKKSVLGGDSVFSAHCLMSIKPIYDLNIQRRKVLCLYACAL